MNARSRTPKKARSPAPKVLGTACAAALPPNALENSLVAIAPTVAVLHDAEGRPAVPPPRRRRAA